ncbi:MAG: hypothetical protein HYY37_06385 [Candidatus Aenigmarchaeota archaeon]|nr:hypothetical protein [Candidatus Aenigmarchaeota archaeon]
MPKISWQDDILSPSDTLRVNFQGKNPFVVCGMFPSLLREVMKISGKDVFETDIRWDITSDPRPFYGIWMGRRKEDRWTDTRLRIIAQGEQSSAEKTGWIRIIMKGYITTQYEYTNFVQKSFWWFYNYGFYYKQRRKYLEFAKDNLFLLRERVQRALAIYREE